ncbi:Lcl C-terminal domain-containing protein [Thiolapillus sp.]
MSKLSLFALSGLWLLASAAMAQTCQTETEVPGSTPSTDFTDHGNGTVTHITTGLMWMKCPLGQSGADCATGNANTYSWQQALETADGYSFAGYSDWRLPNIKELSSLVEQRCYGPAINLSVFPATPGSFFWSSSPYALYSGNAWYVGFGDGHANGGNRGGYAHVRLVRSGQ